MPWIRTPRPDGLGYTQHWENWIIDAPWLDHEEVRQDMPRPSISYEQVLEKILANINRHRTDYPLMSYHYVTEVNNATYNSNTYEYFYLSPEDHERLRQTFIEGYDGWVLLRGSLLQEVSLTRVCVGCDQRLQNNVTCSVCDKGIPGRTGSCDCCECNRCRGCLELTDSDECENCGYAYDCCCDCRECEGCDNRVSYLQDCCDYCENCCQCERDDDRDDGYSNVVYDCSTEPTEYLRFMGKPKNKRYFGIELEVEVYRQDFDAVAREVLSRFDQTGNNPYSSDKDPFVLLKHDGSLSNGFEIVTAPATLEVHRDRWTKFFANLPKGLRSWYSGHCGIHIHVSRKSLSSLSIGKMLVFVNDQKNMAFIDRIAGRRSNGYCQKLNKKLSDGRVLSPNRYEAINTSENNTIEFRIFRGTLKESSFWKNLEFVHALCDWVPTASSRQLSVDNFTQYVDNNKKLYSNLYDFINRKEDVTDNV